MKNFLMRLIEELKRIGFSSDNINVFFSHTLEGPRKPFQINTENSRCVIHRPEHHVMSEGPGGIKFNKAFLESDIKIALSVFEPSYLCGFAAAQHAVFPGLTDSESMASYIDEACGLEDKSIESRVEKLSKTSLKVSKEIPIDLTLNLILYRKGVYGASYGGADESFRKGLSTYKDLFYRSLSKEPRILLASAGGSPYDDQLSGVCQTIMNIMPALKKEDSVIVACECREWIRDRQIFDSLIEKEREIKPKKAEDLVGRALAFMIPELKEKFDVCLVSVIPSYYVRRGLKFRFSRTVNSALQTTMNRNKSGWIAVVEDAYHIHLESGPLG